MEVMEGRGDEEGEISLPISPYIFVESGVQS